MVLRSLGKAIAQRVGSTDSSVSTKQLFSIIHCHILNFFGDYFDQHFAFDPKITPVLFMSSVLAPPVLLVCLFFVVVFFLYLLIFICVVFWLHQ